MKGPRTHFLNRWDKSTGEIDNDAAECMCDSDFLENANPYYAGAVDYGRPMKGHGWHPMTNAELIRMMADHITTSAPPGENTSMWKY